MVEHMTSLFLQQSSLSEVCQQLCPQGLEPLRLYKLPKIHKEVLLGPTVSNFGTPTYQPSKNLADTVWPSWETHQSSWKAPMSLSTTHKTPMSLFKHWGLNRSDLRTWSVSVWFHCSQGCHIGWPSSSWADTSNTTSWHCSVMSWPIPTSASVVSSARRSMECQWDCCFLPLSIHMEDFRRNSMNEKVHKHLCWFHYIDDIFVIWPTNWGSWKSFWSNSVMPTRTSNSLPRNREIATFPAFKLTSTGDIIAHWAKGFTRNSPTPTSA